MQYLTARQVAERYGVNLVTVRKHLTRKKFEREMKGGQIRLGDTDRDMWLIHKAAAEKVYGKDEANE